VADLSKKRGTIACPRCKAAMEEVVRIAPVQNEPGLIGYECPSCCYVTSVLTPPKSPRRSDEWTQARLGRVLRRKRGVRSEAGCSGDFLPPPPPAEKATARPDLMSATRCWLLRRDGSRHHLPELGHLL